MCGPRDVNGARFGSAQARILPVVAGVVGNAVLAAKHPARFLAQLDGWH